MDPFELERPSPISSSICYEIVVAELLEAKWASWLGPNLSLIVQQDQSTRLFGPLPDQAALHGVLSRIRDLGLILISLQRYEQNDYNKQQGG